MIKALSEFEDIIPQIALFRDVDLEELDPIFHCFMPSVKKYDADESITMEGHEFTGLGIILEGTAIVTKTNEAGERIIMSQLNKGDLFGEMIAFSDLKRWPATVIAKKRVTVMFIKPDTIINECHRLCVGHRQILLNMLRIVSNKALGLNRKVNYLSIKSMRGKLSKFLVEECKKQNKKMFEIAFNRNELAEFLHVSRPSMSRELGRMKSEGIIDYHQNTFKIVDADKIRDYASHLN